MINNNQNSHRNSQEEEVGEEEAVSQSVVACDACVVAVVLYDSQTACYICSTYTYVRRTTLITYENVRKNKPAERFEAQNTTFEFVCQYLITRIYDSTCPSCTGFWLEIKW